MTRRSRPADLNLEEVLEVLGVDSLPGEPEDLAGLVRSINRRIQRHGYSLDYYRENREFIVHQYVHRINVEQGKVIEFEPRLTLEEVKDLLGVDKLPYDEEFVIEST